jgi:hypothetical protein
MKTEEAINSTELRSLHPNRVDKEVENASLKYSLEHPIHNCLPAA